jgi:hypothetical protein
VRIFWITTGSSIPATQASKSAREGDDMFDRDLVIGHDDALDEEPHEPLAASEVE